MKLPLTYDNYIFDLYGTLVEHCMRQRSLRSAMRHL